MTNFYGPQKFNMRIIYLRLYRCLVFFIRSELVSSSLVERISTVETWASVYCVRIYLVNLIVEHLVSAIYSTIAQ